MQTARSSGGAGRRTLHSIPATPVTRGSNQTNQTFCLPPVPEWMSRAACLAVNPSDRLFDADDDFVPSHRGATEPQDSISARAARLDRGRAMCAACPVAAQCAEMYGDSRAVVHGGNYQDTSVGVTHDPATERICDHCKSAFIPERFRGRPQSYCSKQCRWAVSNRRQREAAGSVTPVVDPDKPCEVCGAQYDRTDYRSKYCSQPCRQVAKSRTRREYERAVAARRKARINPVPVEVSS